MANNKPKVARAVQPNAGLRHQYAKKLLRFFREFEKQVADEIFLYLAQRSLIANDWSLSHPKSQKDKDLLKRITKGVLASIKRDPVSFEQDIDAFVAKHITDWVINASSVTTKIALWVARSIAADVSAAQRSAYIASGIPLELITKKWTIPIVNQHFSELAQKRLPMLVDWAVGLISHIMQNDVERIKVVVTKAFLDGKRVSEIRRELEKTSGFTKERAQNVALDQTNKISNGVALANDEALGISHGIWVHVMGKYTSRETHIKMNGKKFKLKEGLYDPAVGRNVQCAELPYCRCIYRAIIDWDEIARKKNEK